MEPRPYYHRFAWAYDLLQSGPIVARIQFIIRELRAHNVRPPKPVLDAGCGTGRYSAALAAHGFTVLGTDQSPELIAIAQHRRAASEGNERYQVSNLLTFEPPASFDAVLCRGVLNDFTDDANRRLIFRRFADWLAPGGVLIFDVRDWEASASRYSKQPIASRQLALTDGGELIFESSTVPIRGRRELRVRETFQHRHGQSITTTENEFTMRCWSRAELEEVLAIDFRDVSIYPSYGEPGGVWTDRLVVIAVGNSI